MANYVYNYDKEQERYIPPQKLQENRSYAKFLILTIITLGWYSLFFFISFSSDMNKITGYKGEKTMNYIFAFFLSFITGSITMQIWLYQITTQLSQELKTRNIDYNFSTTTFWQWNVLGSFIFIGTYVFLYRLIKAGNLLAEDYNRQIDAETNAQQFG